MASRSYRLDTAIIYLNLSPYNIILIMNQIAVVDGFNIMNDLRLVIIVALFISMIIVLLLNWILGARRRRVKLKYMPHDDSSREERLAPGAVNDFFAMEESTKEEKSM